MKSKKGFTLLELLVVVLIIGVLTAIAIPQYQKAVEKSKAAQAITWVKAISNALKIYILDHGSRNKNFDELNIDIPCEKKAYQGSYHCDTEDWRFSLVKPVDGSIGIRAERTSGKYKGNGFAIWENSSSSARISGKLYCIESTADDYTLPKGDYCQKLFFSEPSKNGGNSYRWFGM